MIQPFIYQPNQFPSLYQEVYENRLRAYQIQQQNQRSVDDYIGSIIKDPNFTKDNAYNPYINQKLSEILEQNRALYKSGKISASEFKYKVGTEAAKLRTWVSTADQIMTGIVDPSVEYYKGKGGNVAALKNRTAKQIFTNPDGSWKDGAQLQSELKEGKFDRIVSDVANNYSDIAFTDTKALDQWLETFKPEKQSISETKSVTVKGQKTGSVVAGSEKGVADYYPAWQSVEKVSDIPTGVSQKTVDINIIKSNDAVYLSAKSALIRQKAQLNPPKNPNDKIEVTDDEIASYVTNYANTKRPFQFTKAEGSKQANITYKQTTNVNVPSESPKFDTNIFNRVLSEGMDEAYFHKTKYGPLALNNRWINQGIVTGYKFQKDPLTGEDKKVPVRAKMVLVYPNESKITITDQDDKKQVVVAGTPGYEELMTQLSIDNPWLLQAGGRIFPGKKGFGVKGPQK